MAALQQEEPSLYTAAFLDKEPRSSYFALQTRLRHAKEFQDQLADFFAARRGAEEAYVKQLHKLARRMHEPKFLPPTYKRMYERLIAELGDVAQLHTSFAEHLLHAGDALRHAPEHGAWSTLARHDEEVAPMLKEMNALEAQLSRPHRKWDLKRSSAKDKSPHEALERARQAWRAHADHAIVAYEAADYARLHLLRDTTKRIIRAQSELGKGLYDMSRTSAEIVQAFHPIVDMQQFIGMRMPDGSSPGAASVPLPSALEQAPRETPPVRTSGRAPPPAPLRVAPPRTSMQSPSSPLPSLSSPVSTQARAHSFSPGLDVHHTLGAADSLNLAPTRSEEHSGAAALSDEPAVPASAPQDTAGGGMDGAAPSSAQAEAHAAPAASAVHATPAAHATPAWHAAPAEHATPAAHAAPAEHATPAAHAAPAEHATPATHAAPAEHATPVVGQSTAEAEPMALTATDTAVTEQRPAELPTSPFRPPESVPREPVANAPIPSEFAASERVTMEPPSAEPRTTEPPARAEITSATPTPAWAEPATTHAAAPATSAAVLAASPVPSHAAVHEPAPDAFSPSAMWLTAPPAGETFGASIYADDMASPPPSPPPPVPTSAPPSFSPSLSHRPMSMYTAWENAPSEESSSRPGMPSSPGSSHISASQFVSSKSTAKYVSSHPREAPAPAFAAAPSVGWHGADSDSHYTSSRATHSTRPLSFSTAENGLSPPLSYTASPPLGGGSPRVRPASYMSPADRMREVSPARGAAPSRPTPPLRGASFASMHITPAPVHESTTEDDERALESIQAALRASHKISGDHTRREPGPRPADPTVSAVPASLRPGAAPRGLRATDTVGSAPARAAAGRHAPETDTAAPAAAVADRAAPELSTAAAPASVPAASPSTAPAAAPASARAAEPASAPAPSAAGASTPLRLQLLERVNAVWQAGHIVKVMVVGEVRVQHDRPLPSVPWTARLHLRASRPMAQVRMRAGVEPGATPHTYDVDTSVWARDGIPTAPVLEYELAGDDLAALVPLRLEMQWRCEAQQSSVLVSHALANGFAHAETLVPRFRIVLPPTPAVTGGVLSQPVGKWDPDTRELVWHGAAASGRSALRFPLASQGAPLAIAAEWAWPGVLLSGADVELEASSAVRVADTQRSTVSGQYFVQP